MCASPQRHSTDCQNQYPNAHSSHRCIHPHTLPVQCAIHDAPCRGVVLAVAGPAAPVKLMPAVAARHVTAPTILEDHHMAAGALAGVLPGGRSEALKPHFVPHTATHVHILSSLNLRHLVQILVVPVHTTHTKGSSSSAQDFHFARTTTPRHTAATCWRVLDHSSTPHAPSAPTSFCRTPLRGTSARSRHAP